MSFALKQYQDRALTTLSTFFSALRSDGLVAAWDSALHSQGRPARPYDAHAFGEVPCVCLRLPTGGGKTLLAAHAVARTGKTLCDTDAPIALWLVPSDAIRSQTLEALSDARHPYRMALESYFPGRVRVCELENLATVGPHEIGKNAIIIVATIQAFRVGDTTTRSVYAFDEQLHPHFQHLSPQGMAGLETVSEADLAAQPYFTTKDLGRVKASLANWLHLYRPIIVVDEAHNGRTDKTFLTLKRMNPACIIELTATPVTGSNVLYHVSALELKTENMIKLPIVLAEHPTGWRDAIRDALLTRHRLETLAQSEPQYLRPIALLQAQNKDGEVTVEVLKQHLIEQENIPAQEIAIATGNQKELNGINLFDPLCPVRYVITVEALKEGWDCSFAYVLCSMQEVRSAKDVEQLLGRVLRMPYAARRQHPDLNQAYAHIIARSFAEAAESLTDSLVNNMGFDPIDAALALMPRTAPLFDTTSTEQHTRPLLPDMAVTLPVMPTQPIPAELAQVLSIHPTSVGATVTIRGKLTPAVEDFLLTATPAKHQATVKQKIEQQRAMQAAATSPSAQGIPFMQLPLLCLEEEGELYPVDKEMLSELGALDLLSERITLEGFRVREEANVFEIDLFGKKVGYSSTDPQQLHLNDIPIQVSEQELVRWLDGEVRQMDILQAQMMAYLTQMVQHLQRDKTISLTALVRAKYQLADALREDVKQRRGRAVLAGFQRALPGMTVAQMDEGFRYTFSFRPGCYAARPPYYTGRYQFHKHYFGNATIHALKEKKTDGNLTEEFLCARAIDTHPQIKHWVRNVEKESLYSFKLPTSGNDFYPDFVCELMDGRVLVVEYKGAHLEGQDRARECRQVGHQWESTSGGRCLFIMAVRSDDQERDVRAQLDQKISG